MSMDQWTDKQLIDRWQNAKDRNAYQILDDRHRPHITRYVRRSLDGYFKDFADDIAQDVFTELLTTGQVFYDGPALAKWLLTAADRHVGMFFRRQGRKKRDARRTVELSTLLREQGGRDSERGERTSRENVREEFISHENPEELACRNEMARLVRSLIDRLPGKQREVMLKMYVEHHSLGSAAEAMGISRNAASTHLARAKQALWAMHEIQQLADHSNSEPPVPREPAKTVGRSLQNLPKLILILFAVRGEVADACNLDMPCGVCTAKNDDDEVSREDSGHHQADKQRRKSLMRLPLRPVAAVAGRTVLDREHPSVRARLAERREASTLLPDFGPSRNDRRDGGGILFFRTAQSARSPSKMPQGTTLETA